MEEMKNKLNGVKQTELDEMLTDVCAHLKFDIDMDADRNIQALMRACDGLASAINHVNNRLNHAMDWGLRSSDCVLCLDGDIHKGGGVFWTDDRWICGPCWGKVADVVRTDSARDKPFVRGARTF